MNSGIGTGQGYGIIETNAISKTHDLPRRAAPADSESHLRTLPPETSPRYVPYCNTFGTLSEGVGDMIGTIIGLTALAIAFAGGVLAFGFSRGFVRRRLRFVDAVQSPVAPYLAAGIGLLLIWPLTLLPLIGGGTMSAVALGAGLGTASGVKALRRGDVG